jgi:large subunit ribosomal protein L19
MTPPKPKEVLEKIVLAPVNKKAREALDIRSGDTVRVEQRIVEKGKLRLQAFEGLVIAVKHGKEAGATFTVRKVTSGVGVEKIFPLYSPMIESIDITKRSKVRRAKLYHVREKAAKEIRRQMRNIRALPDNAVVLDDETGEVKEAEAEVVETTETKSE